MLTQSWRILNRHSSEPDRVLKQRLHVTGDWIQGYRFVRKGIELFKTSVLKAFDAHDRFYRELFTKYRGTDMGTTQFHLIQLSLRTSFIRLNPRLTMVLQDLMQINSRLKMDF